MTLFFQRLIARQQGQANTVQPRMPARFEPARPAAEPFAPGAAPRSTAQSRAWETPVNFVPAVPKSSPLDQALTAPPPVAPPPSQSVEPTSRSPESVRSESHLSSVSTVPLGPFPVSVSTEISTSSEPSFAPPAPSSQQSLSLRLDAIARQIQQFALVSSEPAFDLQASQSTSADFSAGADPAKEKTVLSGQAISAASDARAAAALSSPAVQPSYPASPDASTSEVSAIFSPQNPPDLSAAVPPLMPHQPLPPLAPVLLPPTPTIQVSIGRIEIRATAPAVPKPSPRPAPSLRRPAVSLDNYLQQRSRRS